MRLCLIKALDINANFKVSRVNSIADRERTQSRRRINSRILIKFNLGGFSNKKV